MLAQRADVTSRKPRTALTVRFESTDDLDAVHARAKAAGYRSTEEYARRVLLGFEPARLVRDTVTVGPVEDLHVDTAGYRLTVRTAALRPEGEDNLDDV